MKNDDVRFAARVREEIYASKPLQEEGKRSFAYGLFLTANQFDQNHIKLLTESEATARLACRALSDITGLMVVPTVKRTKNRTEMFSVESSSQKLIRIVMFYFNHLETVNRSLAEDDIHAFFAGVFLSCGTVSNPERGYHLAFQPPSEELADYLFELLTKEGCPPKTTFRRGKSVLYYKDSEPIEEILTMVGAIKSTLKLMELKIYKDLRNRANRATNCETANIDKLVKSSSVQLRDIALLRETDNFNKLAPHLREMAMLRENNPDAPLGELAQLAGISRSGVYHRIKKINQAAERVKVKGK